MTEPTSKEAAAFAQITQARLTLGRRGVALPTQAALTFALDHARAREAVTSELDIAAIGTALGNAGLAFQAVPSAAPDRDAFIRRPDLGRRLPDAAAEDLAQYGPVDVALVLGDGLSAVAVALNGAAFMRVLCGALDARGLRVSPVILARQARVALGDGIAVALQAKTVVMALGERPGLSAADSLGIYITHMPGPDTQDSARNCISNVRDAGLSVDVAADQTAALIDAMRAAGRSGVALNRMSSGLTLSDQGGG